MRHLVPLTASILAPCVLASCTSSGKDTGTARETCTTAAYHFEEGPDELPSAVIAELTEVVMDVVTDIPGASDKALAEQIAVAGAGALNGQLAWFVSDAIGSTDPTDVFQASTRMLTDTLGSSRRKGKKPLFVCEQVADWASGAGITPEFTCGEVSLSGAMTQIISKQFADPIDNGDLQGGVWLQLGAASSSLDVLWLPVFLAMQNGASPALLSYEKGGVTAHVSILALGIDVHGPQPAVDDFWAFVQGGGFDAKTYSPGMLASTMAQLTLVAPSHVVWRGPSGVASWNLGDQNPPAFLEMDYGTAIIDPCDPDKPAEERAGVVGGVNGACVNTLEVMFAVTHEVKGYMEDPLAPSVSICDKVPSYLSDNAL